MTENSNEKPGDHIFNNEFLWLKDLLEETQRNWLFQSTSLHIYIHI